MQWTEEIFLNEPWSDLKRKKISTRMFIARLQEKSKILPMEVAQEISEHVFAECSSWNLPIRLELESSKRCC